MNQFVITLPLPSRDLSPNSRCHWRRKANAVKSYRETACGLALKAKPRKHIPLEAATVQCRFFFAQKRRRDADNFESRMKAGWDGLVDAKVFQDDNRLTHLPCEQAIDRENPRVEVWIFETNETSVSGSNK